MKREDHTFQFTAKQIADAAAKEAAYHEGRIDHWTVRRDKALAIVEQTIGAKVEHHRVSNGVQAQIVVDYGDPAAWREYQLAYGKINTHTEAADRYRTDERLYGSQFVANPVYELDADDVHHFRLGGQARPE